MHSANSLHGSSGCRYCGTAEYRQDARSSSTRRGAYQGDDNEAVGTLYLGSSAAKRIYSVRAAPPLSMWDAPESSGHFFNRFARREVTKAARAAEYWSSDFDEYALPEHGKGPKFTAARSAARSKSPNPSSSKPPAPPPVKLPPSNHKIPEPLPFTFGLADSARPQANLGHFTDTSSSSLALMKSLGLPGDDSPFSSPSPNASPQPPSVSRFHSMASSMSDWKTLGPPEATANTLGPGVQLAKGTKRLGMGRPAPWAPAEKRSRPG